VATATLVVAPLAVAAPPDQPAPVVQSPAPVIEPASTPVEPEPAPVEPEPAPTVEPVEPAPSIEPEPTPELPSWDAELPSYESPSLPPEPELASYPEPIPQDGNGSITIGAMLLGGGAVLAGTSGVLIFNTNDVGIWIAGAALSSVALATGMGLLISGAVKRSRYRPWRLQHRAPPQGTGMLASGSLAVSAGALGIMLGGISLPVQDIDDPPYGEVLLSLGAVSVATGIALLVVGSKRRKSFERWNEARVAPSLGVLPSPQLRPAGATFGVAGRF